MRKARRKINSNMKTKVDIERKGNGLVDYYRHMINFIMIEEFTTENEFAKLRLIFGNAYFITLKML